MFNRPRPDPGFFRAGVWLCILDLWLNTRNEWGAPALERVEVADERLGH
jgi:hypothetical protein